MNHFAGFTTPVVGGHHAMLRFAEDGKAEPVLGPCGAPKIFPTEMEAWKAVTENLLRYFNGHLRRDGETITSARDAAERIFRKGRVIPVEHR